MLLIEQNAEMALQLADRVYVIDHGTVVFEGTPARLREDRRSPPPISASAAEALSRPRNVRPRRLVHNAAKGGVERGAGGGFGPVSVGAQRPALRPLAR